MGRMVEGRRIRIHARSNTEISVPWPISSMLLGVVELSGLLHEISVAFGCSTNLRTLPKRLANGMGRYLPVAEIESLRLPQHRGEVRISAYAPGIARQWEGRRSSRVFDQQRVLQPTWVIDEVARVAIAPIAAKLKLPVGRTGLLGISFETDISVVLGSSESTEILVDVLTLHCLRLGQLVATAARSRDAHHHRPSGTEQSVPEKPLETTEIPVTVPLRPITEIPVEPIDTALVRCISAALGQTRGQIYGTGGAAALLGLKPSTLQSKMRKLGIERSAFTG
jgi:hypothetical protein